MTTWTEVVQQDCRGEDTDWAKKWSMRSRAPDQEVDQKGHGDRLCKKTAKHAI